MPLPPAATPIAQHWGNTAIGLLLACGAAILWLLAPWDLALVLASAVLLLGLHALHSAWRARPSRLSRLGQLP